MKNQVFNFIICAVFSSVCLSCKFDDSNLYPEQVGNGAALSVGDLQVLSPTGGRFTFTFTSSTDWTLSDCPSWLNFSQSSGKSGSSTIIVWADLNDTRADRSAVVTFRSSAYSIPMTVVQEHPYLRISSNDFNFDWDSSQDYSASGQSLTIESNVDWIFINSTATSGNPSLAHFGISESAGKGNMIIKILPSVMNTDKEDYGMTTRLVGVTYDDQGRIQEIPSKAIDGFNIRFFQKHIKFLINETIEPISNSIPELGDTSLVYHVDTEVPWKVQMSSDGRTWQDGLPTWITSNVKSSAAGASDLSLSWRNTNSINTINGGVNPYSENRLVHLRIISTDPTMVSENKIVYRNIELVQRPYILTLGGSAGTSEVRLENDGATDKQINIQSSGAWKIENVPSWMTVSATTGVGNRTVVFKAKERNLATSDLTSTNFRLVSQRNSMTCSVSAVQERFKFDLDYPAVLEAIPTRSTKPYSVSLVSSGGWEVSGKPDWLDISQTTSDSQGRSDIRIGANSVNPDESMDRTASLVFTSLIHKEAGKTLTRTINVKQRKYSFDLTQTALATIPAYSEKYDCKLFVVCSGDWKISSCPSWLTPDILSGDGLSDVNIAFTPSHNTSSASRTGKIEVTDNYKGTVKSINISQDGFVFDAKGMTFSDIDVINRRSYIVGFNLTAGAPWRIETGYGLWVSPDKFSGNGGSSITFTPTPNPYTSKRSTTVRIHSTINNAYKDIVFQQNEYVFDTQAESYSFTELSSDRKSIAVTSSGEWTVSRCPSWVKLSASSGPGNGTVYLTVDKNVDQSSRNGSFIIASDLNNNLSKTVNVSQDAYVFDTQHESFSYDPVNSKTDMFNVVSSGDWRVNECPSWVGLSHTNGYGAEGGKTTTVTINPSNNLDATSRNAVVEIYSADNSSLVKKINVSQGAFVFSLSSSSISFAASNNSDQKVTVKCSGGWTAKSDASWLGVKIENDALLISASDNTSSERKGSVTVTSTMNNKTLTISVTQAKKK